MIDTRPSFSLLTEMGLIATTETIAEAAANDAQLGEGKALSDREETVLQALELLG